MPLVFGGVGYYFFFPEVDFVKVIDSLMNIEKRAVIPLNSLGIKIIRYYGFDFLWAYALMNSLYFILGCDVRAIKYTALLSTVMCVGMEFLQLVSLARGTFDLWDIVVEIMAVVIASLVIKKITLEEEGRK